MRNIEIQSKTGCVPLSHTAEHPHQKGILETYCKQIAQELDASGTAKIVGVPRPVWRMESQGRV